MNAAGRLRQRAPGAGPPRPALRCSSQPRGLLPSISASLNSVGCRPSRIASTMSGARQVSGGSRQTKAAAASFSSVESVIDFAFPLLIRRPPGTRLAAANRDQQTTWLARAAFHRRQRELEVKARAFLPQPGKLGHQRRVTPAAPVSDECAATRNEETSTRAAAPGGCRPPGRPPRSTPPGTDVETGLDRVPPEEAVIVADRAGRQQPVALRQAASRTAGSSVARARIPRMTGPRNPIPVSRLMDSAPDSVQRLRRRPATRWAPPGRPEPRPRTVARRAAGRAPATPRRGPRPPASPSASAGRSRRCDGR